MPDDILKQGRQAAQMGDLPRARALLAKAVSQMPDSAQAWYWLGIVMDDPDKAHYCHERARQLDPELFNFVSSPSEDTGPEPSPAAPIPEKSPIEDLRSGLKTNPGRILPPPRAIRGWILGGAGLLVCIFGLAWFFASLYRNSVPAEVTPVAVVGAGLPEATPREFPTPYPTLTPSLTPTRVPSATPTTTPTLDPTQASLLLSIQITSARNARDTGQYTNCIRYHDRLLTQIPDWPDGLYNRGACLRLAAGEFQETKSPAEDILQAIQYVDTAISLGPLRGDYLVELGYAYSDLADTYENPADREAAREIALDNVRAGMYLGTTYSDVTLHEAAYLVDLGRCREAVDIGVNQILPFQADLDYAAAFRVLGKAFICLARYSTAVEYIQVALEVQSNCTDIQHKATALLGLGEKDEALTVINSCLDSNPQAGRYAFFQRALIFFDAGDFGRAREDIQAGLGADGFQGGLPAYLQGTMALVDGNQEEALEWFNAAALNYYPYEGPWLKKRIQNQLNSLGEAYPQPTPAILWEVTPLPEEYLAPPPDQE